MSPGTRLGAYDIVGLIGAGGMGEVYRALDTRLDRQVALKTLPDVFRADTERVARFAREARLLASLNHPNIAAIHGLEQSDGEQFIVMEMVEGETLAERIARGPIPAPEAFHIAKQIAEALEAAHERGVIHRDLKPANIKLTPADQVKVLDFGLAKAFAPEVGDAAPPALVDSPTITGPAAVTGVGMLLGTAAFMSPEQAKGKPADKRADVWAFGCVLYEMLTGARPFDGDDMTDVLGAVVRLEPDWSRVPPDTPAAVRALLVGCLTKDRRERISDIAAALFVLEAPDVFRAHREIKRSGTLGVSLNADVAQDGTLVYVLAPALAPVRRLSWMDRTGKAIGTVADESLPFPRYPRLSPTDSQLAITVGASNAGEIWIYDLTGGSQPRRLTFQGHNVLPAWMPDGRRVVFRSGSVDTEWSLNLLHADGTSQRAEPLADGSWPSISPDGQSIVFSRFDSRTRGDLWRLSLRDEGKPQAWLQTPASESESEFSPDGRWVAYVSDETGRPEIWVRPFPGPGPAVRVSANGGHMPTWSRDGRELLLSRTARSSFRRGFWR